MPDTRPIPDLAKTAYRLLRDERDRAERAYRLGLAEIGMQTVAVLGLSEADGWVVNFDTGLLEPPTESIT